MTKSHCDVGFHRVSWVELVGGDALLRFGGDAQAIGSLAVGPQRVMVPSSQARVGSSFHTFTP